jgi:hypothetical protein
LQLLFTHLDWSIIDDDTTNAMLDYEPTLPLHPPPPTTHYLAVSSSSSSSTNAVIVRHCRHRRHHGVGCCLVPLAATPTSSPLSSTAKTTPPTTASPPPRLVLLPPPVAVAVASSPPSRSPMAPCVMRHGPACGVDALPPGPTRQVPLLHAPPLSGYGPIAPAPPSLSGGRR